MSTSSSKILASLKSVNLPSHSSSVLSPLLLEGELDFEVFEEEEDFLEELDDFFEEDDFEEPEEGFLELDEELFFELVPGLEDDFEDDFLSDPAFGDISKLANVSPNSMPALYRILLEELKKVGLP